MGCVIEAVVRFECYLDHDLENPHDAAECLSDLVTYIEAESLDKVVDILVVEKNGKRLDPQSYLEALKQEAVNQ